MPLQKSFSEQHASARSKQSWHRSKTYSAAPDTTPTTAPKPLQPVSEASRNKLHAFEFQAPVEPDNHGTSATIIEETTQGDPEKRIDGLTRSQDHTVAERAAITPHSKLVWQELVGDTEEKEEEEDTSPNERILWESKRAEGVPNLSPMITRRRGKKRARSSSPTSSPSSYSKPATPAVNVKKLTQALKSAHADPAIDLWDRFALSGSTNITPRGGANPALAQIMVSSSPQPSKTLPPGGKGSATPNSLRRAISCGVNWPKRRRTERGEYIGQPRTAMDESPSHGTKTSMVNALLDSVNGELNRSKAIQTRHDALKSPSPKKRGQQHQTSVNAANRISPPPRPPPPLFRSPPRAAATGTGADLVRTAAREDLSDYGDVDFDDDDFDEDTLMVLEASLVPGDEETISATLSPDTGPKAHPRTMPTPPQISEEDDDEFGGMDDDVFAAAEDLIAEIDSSRTSHITPGNTTDSPAVVRHMGTNSRRQDAGEDAYDDDDFGDDFDFEAAEVSATQAAKHMGSVGGSVPSVR
ncbi:hypothetical protein BKA67DRAFT_577791, partial [Truncatella angustata]